MITLHGFSYSNYYNIVKHVLMHKGIPFEEDLQYGGEEAYLAISPLGKIPAITTEQGGHLSESSVCCDFLEETYPEQPLYPTDVFGRARVRQEALGPRASTTRFSSPPSTSTLRAPAALSMPAVRAPSTRA